MSFRKKRSAGGPVVIRPLRSRWQRLRADGVRVPVGQAAGERPRTHPARHAIRKLRAPAGGAGSGVRRVGHVREVRHPSSTAWIGSETILRGG
jgi:hypothetical protein